MIGLKAEDKYPGVALNRGVSTSMALSSLMVVGVEETCSRERFFGGIVAQFPGL